MVIAVLVAGPTGSKRRLGRCVYHDRLLIHTYIEKRAFAFVGFGLGMIASGILIYLLM